MIKEGGRYMVTGQIDGPGKEVPVRPGFITRQQLTIMGTWSGHIAEYRKALEFMKATRAKYDFGALVPNRYRLDQATEALSAHAGAGGHQASHRSARSRKESDVRPLDGMRVLEMGQYIAAPYCAMMLADLGAEVIKIEKPDGGDPRRTYDPLERTDSGSMSGGFLSYNRNKKSVTLDLTDGRDRDRYRALAGTADVVVENLRPGAVDRLGVGYEVLKEENPRLVYCAISGYGRLSTHRGEYADTAGLRHRHSGDRRADGSHRRTGWPTDADGDRVRGCLHRRARHRGRPGRSPGT